MLTPETSSFFAGVAVRSIQYDKHNHDIHCKTLHFLTPGASSFFAGVAARSIQYEKKKNHGINAVLFHHRGASSFFCWRCRS